LQLCSNTHERRETYAGRAKQRPEGAVVQKLCVFTGSIVINEGGYGLYSRHMHATY